MECNCFSRDGKNCIEIVPIFSNLSNKEKIEVAGVTSEKTFEKGELIYMAGDKGDKLYVIHSGKVKVSRISDTGKEQVIRILGSGEFMGELSLFSASELKDNSEALSKVVMCVIQAESLKDLMKKYPEISIKIVEELSMRLESVEALIENISIHTVERRIADTLINFANENGEVKLNMSKRDLASHIGMSGETLSRKLRSFEEEGWIKLIGHRRIIILNESALESII